VQVRTYVFTTVVFKQISISHEAISANTACVFVKGQGKTRIGKNTHY